TSQGGTGRHVRSRRRREFWRSQSPGHSSDGKAPPHAEREWFGSTARSALRGWLMVKGGRVLTNKPRSRSPGGNATVGSVPGGAEGRQRKGRRQDRVRPTDTQRALLEKGVSEW